MLPTHQISAYIDSAKRLGLGVQASLIRHWQKSAIFFGVTVLLTLVSLLFVPKHYVSSAKVRVGFGRNLVLDPTASSGEKISYFESRENELNSLLEVLSSRSLLDQVVETIGARNILSGRLPKGMTSETIVEQMTAGKNVLSAEVTPSTMAASARTRLHQLAVAKLEKEIGVNIPKKTNIIAIHSKAKTPEMAQAIVATLVATYLNEHLRIHDTPGSFQFFVEQADAAEQHWQKSAGKLRDAKDLWGIVTIEGKRNLLQSQIGEIDTKLLTSRSELAGSKGHIESLAKQLEKLPESIELSSLASPNAAADNMRTEYYKLQAIEQERFSRMAPDHPQMIALQAQMTDLKAILDEQDPTRRQPTTGANPSRQALELTWLKEKSAVDALEARALALVKQQAALGDDLRQLNKHEIEIAELQREVDLSEARFRNYHEKREQARMNQQLDADRISNLSIVQPASFVTKSFGSSRMLMLLLGMFVGAVGAVGLAIGWDQALPLLKPVFQSRSQIESLLGLPVLGQVFTRTVRTKPAGPAKSDPSPAPSVSAPVSVTPRRSLVLN